MNEPLDTELEQEDDEEPQQERHISLIERVLRMGIGALGAYIVGYFLTVFFWGRVANPHGPALLSLFAFLALAGFLTVAEWRSQRDQRP